MFKRRFTQRERKQMAAVLRSVLCFTYDSKAAPKFVLAFYDFEIDEEGDDVQPVVEVVTNCHHEGTLELLDDAIRALEKD